MKKAIIYTSIIAVGGIIISLYAHKQHVKEVRKIKLENYVQAVKDFSDLRKTIRIKQEFL